MAAGLAAERPSSGASIPEPPAAEPDSGAPPPLLPPAIQAPQLPETPAAGKGRLALQFSGNRRWCTAPDDRVVKVPRGPAKPGPARDEIITFGYMFTVAAIKRGAPETPIMLFESPVFRTASWRTAAKLGQGRKRVTPGPGIGAGSGVRSASPGTGPGRGAGISPDTLVPYWQEQNRCTEVPGRFDFDVDPGTYDVYLAFDLMTREGGWIHRHTAYVTDITVAEGRATQVDGVIDQRGGQQREVSLAAPPPSPGGPAAPAAAADSALP